MSLFVKIPSVLFLSKKNLSSVFLSVVCQFVCHVWLTIVTHPNKSVNNRYIDIIHPDFDQGDVPSTIMMLNNILWSMCPVTNLYHPPSPRICRDHHPWHTCNKYMNTSNPRYLPKDDQYHLRRQGGLFNQNIFSGTIDNHQVPIWIIPQLNWQYQHKTIK